MQYLCITKSTVFSIICLIFKLFSLLYIILSSSLTMQNYKKK